MGGARWKVRAARMEVRPGYEERAQTSDVWDFLVLSFFAEDQKLSMGVGRQKRKYVKFLEALLLCLFECLLV